MIITVTERGVYKRCRRQWMLSSANRENLQPALTINKALDFGTLVHKSLADWVLDPKSDLSMIFLAKSSEMVAQLEANYIARIGVKPSNEETAPLMEVIRLGVSVMTNYQAYHKTPLPAGMCFALPEQQVIVPIPGTEHTCEDCGGLGRLLNREVHESSVEVCVKCNGTGIALHYLSGTLDGLIQNTQDRLFVLEHKTYSRRPDLRILNQTDQFLAYLWLVRQLNIGPIGGIAYDGMWKRATPPRGKKINDLFFRTRLHRTPDEIDQFGIDLIAEVNEMANLATPMTYNRRWEGCHGDCRYDDICQAMNRREDVDRIKTSLYMQRPKNVPMERKDIDE